MLVQFVAATRDEGRSEIGPDYRNETIRDMDNKAHRTTSAWLIAGR